MIKKIKWLGHASIRIEEEGKNIYIDPWKLKNFSKKADIILVTHSHHDHFSIDDILKITKKETLIVGPLDVLNKINIKNKKEVLPGGKIDMEWVKIEGIASYNLNKSFHPKSNNWLGYILKFKDFSVYIAGDTDFIPEMKNVKTEISILPVGGTYTMDPKEAAEAVNTMKPKIAIPIHFGDVVGSLKDAQLFKSLVKESEVRIFEISE